MEIFWNLYFKALGVFRCISLILVIVNVVLYGVTFSHSFRGLRRSVPARHA